MPLKLSATLLGIALLAGIVVAAIQVVDTVSSDHDGWDIFAAVDPDAVPIMIEPPNLLGRQDREALSSVVEEARRDWGIAWSVHVVETAGDDSPDADEIAAQRFAEYPVETSEGAADGLLMVVVVPREDHSNSQVAFVTGRSFYPEGGITPERLDYIADVQMAALIDEARVGAASVEGATWVKWTQLFESTPDAPATSLEHGLQELLEPIGASATAGLAAIVALAAVTVQALTLRGAAIPPRPDRLNGVLAATASRGRVDGAVITGIILDAADRGLLTLGDDGRISIGHAPALAGRSWDAAIVDAVATVDARGDRTTVQTLDGELASDATFRQRIEDTMAAEGLFHPKSPVVTAVMRAMAAAGGMLGLLMIVVSVAAESAPAVGAGIALAGVGLVTLVWNERRSWTTWAGRTAARRWREAHAAPEDRERGLFESIVGMETIDLLPVGRSPLNPGAQQLLGGLGSSAYR